MTRVVNSNGHLWEIESDVPRASRLDALATRMANDVIAGKYANARDAAKANIVEYAGHETKYEDRRNTQVGNFTRKIRKTMKNMGYGGCEEAT